MVNLMLKWRRVGRDMAVMLVEERRLTTSSDAQMQQQPHSCLTRQHDVGVEVLADVHVAPAHRAVEHERLGIGHQCTVSFKWQGSVQHKHSPPTAAQHTLCTQARPSQK